jgi:glucose-6-phosphate 1-dehydrogenase
MESPARPAGPCVLVIFGAAGDLTKRLIIPALCNLRRANLLPEAFAVIGISRHTMNDDTFRRELGLAACGSHKAAPSTGYETLIYDCMVGDATLFQRADSIEAGWRVVQPALDAWATDSATKLPIYAAGSAGPSEADTL